jgi:hypothetical protein
VSVAWENGVRLIDSSGPLHDFIDSNQFANQEISVYKGLVYVFVQTETETTLVNAYELPKGLTQDANNQARQRWISKNPKLHARQESGRTKGEFLRITMKMIEPELRELIEADRARIRNWKIAKGYDPDNYSLTLDDMIELGMMPPDCKGGN